MQYKRINLVHSNKISLKKGFMREMPSYLDFPGIPLESAASWSTRQHEAHTDPTPTKSMI